MRKPDNADIGLREDCEDDLVDVGCNADLYVANQESTDSIREAQELVAGRGTLSPVCV